LHSTVLSYTRSLHQYTAVAITATAAGAHTHAPHQLPRAHVKQWQCPASTSSFPTVAGKFAFAYVHCVKTTLAFCIK